MENLPTTFGQKMRIVRILRQMSQEELAAAAGISRVSISNLETDTYNPRPETEAAIRKALNWSPGVDSIFAQVIQLSTVETDLS